MSSETLQPAKAQVSTRQISSRTRPVFVRPVELISVPLLSIDNKPEVDLRPEIASLNIPIRNQAGRNTCSVFAMTFLLDFMYAKHFGMKNADFSEEFLNYASNVATGANVDGGFFDEIDLGYKKMGDVPEAIAPYNASFNPNINYSAAIKAQAAGLKPRLKPHFIKKWDVTTGLLPSHIISIIIQIKQGRPVAAGLRWPKDGKFQTQNILGVTMMTAPAPADVVDGHSIVFVGYKVSDHFPGGGYLVFRNHWRTTFMDKGYGYMTFDYATKYTNDLVQYLLP